MHHFWFGHDVIGFKENEWNLAEDEEQLNRNLLSLVPPYKRHNVKLFKILDFQHAHIKSFRTKCQMLQTALYQNDFALIPEPNS